MHEQWVSASKALALLNELSGGAVDERTICDRARTGALRASARLLNIEGDSRPNVVLRASFWDWPRYAEAEQEWGLGDFSVTLDGLRHDAIGVAFDLAGLSDMLPFEVQSELALRLSVAGDPAWVTAQAARAFMYTELAAQPTKAGAILLDQCLLGFIAPRAVLRQESATNDFGQWCLEEREWGIPVWFWKEFLKPGTSSQDWERGVFSGKGRGPSGRRSIRLSGVHFSRKSLMALVPGKTNSEVSDVPLAAKGGGRPSAAFWDDLWCGVWGRIFRGELIPTCQADIERAMLDWAVANDQPLSESAARQRARKLFTEYESEGKNSDPPSF
jgi:hypothetical protein